MSNPNSLRSKTSLVVALAVTGVVFMILRYAVSEAFSTPPLFDDGLTLRVIPEAHGLPFAMGWGSLTGMVVVALAVALATAWRNVERILALVVVLVVADILGGLAVFGRSAAPDGDWAQYTASFLLYVVQVGVFWGIARQHASSAGPIGWFRAAAIISAFGFVWWLNQAFLLLSVGEWSLIDLTWYSAPFWMPLALASALFPLLKPRLPVALDRAAPVWVAILALPLASAIGWVLLWPLTVLPEGPATDWLFATALSTKLWPNSTVVALGLVAALSVVWRTPRQVDEQRTLPLTALVAIGWTVLVLVVNAILVFGYGYMRHPLVLWGGRWGDMHPF